MKDGSLLDSDDLPVYLQISISRKRVAGIVAAAMVLAAATVQRLAQDAPAGARKSVPCQACHGCKAFRSCPTRRILPAQPQSILSVSLKGFAPVNARTDHEPDAKPLSDEDIRDLAGTSASFQMSQTSRAIAMPACIDLNEARIKALQRRPSAAFLLVTP